MAGRPKGARGAGYEAKRLDLIERVRAACFADPAQRLSFREMAAAASSSVPTLKHYFGDREGLVSAILEQAWRDADTYLSASFDPQEPLQQRIESVLDQFKIAITHFDLDRLHVWGLNEGLSSKLSGPAYLNYFLEPTLQAAERWLGEYKKAGKINEDVDVRYAAITLYAPCLILVMHQDYLGGSEVRVADKDHFMRDHAARFAAYLGVG